MSVAREPLDDTPEFVGDAPAALEQALEPPDGAPAPPSGRSWNLAGPELRQRSVRDLLAELAQLEDSTRASTSSSRVVAGSAARANHIITELRRR